MYICVTDDMQSSSTVATLGVLWTQHAILSTHSSAPLVPSGEMSLSCLVQLLGPWTFRKGLPLFLGGWWRRVVGEAGASTSKMVLGWEGLSSAGDQCETGRGSSHLLKWQKCMPTGTRPYMDVPVASWPCKAISLELWGNFLLLFRSLVTRFHPQRTGLNVHPRPLPTNPYRVPLSVCVYVMHFSEKKRKEKESLVCFIKENKTTKQSSSGSHCCRLHLFRYHFHQEASFRSSVWVWCVHPPSCFPSPHFYPYVSTWSKCQSCGKRQSLSSN